MEEEAVDDELAEEKVDLAMLKKSLGPAAEGETEEETMDADDTVAEDETKEEVVDEGEDTRKQPVAIGTTRWKWTTPEVHMTKGEAFQFVAGKVGQLLHITDQLKDGVATTEAHLAVLSEDVVVREDPPETYVPWRFHGPPLYAVIDKIGVNRTMWAEKRNETLERASQAGVVPVDEVVDPVYWDLHNSWSRNVAACSSLRTFNRRYLSIKRQALAAMRDTITSQLPGLLADFMDAHTNLGASRIDLENIFQDVDVHVSFPSDGCANWLERDDANQLNEYELGDYNRLLLKSYGGEVLKNNYPHLPVEEQKRYRTLHRRGRSI